MIKALCAGLDKPQRAEYCSVEALQNLQKGRGGVPLARGKSEKFIEIAGKEPTKDA